MEVKPGYKKTEAGVLPNEWSIRPLGDVVTFLDGLRRPVKDTDRAKMKGDVPYYGASGIVDYVNAHLFNEDLILLGEDGENIVSRSTRLAFRISGKAWVNNHAHVLRPNPGMHIGYLVEYLESLNYERFNTGTAQPKLNRQTCAVIPVACPPEREQKAIAQSLSDSDDLIQSLERLIAKKRGLKQAAKQQLLTGQMRLPGFGGEWQERTFADLFFFSGGYSASREQLSHVGHCYLHYGDIHTTARTCIDLRTDTDSIPRLNVALGQVAPASLLADGDVVFVDASEDVDGTSRHVVVANPEGVPFISGLHTIVAKGKDGSLDREYKRFCFQAEAIKRQFRFYAVGTKVSGVSKTNIARMSMRVPSLPEQKAIAEVLSDMDAEITALEARLAKTRDIKQGMMQELLTGRTRLV